ncbi:Glycosyltransferase involved in cell wall bisynthesis [Oceanobacillus limi]|uniref:Glycosyltransferase involved in cell wall bisynthesis n=1 Tax=Oceanobacillus limi TaxID=930131 RepID=A0A1I0A4K7_9BACI|nr:glycosyltransferase [Oceanobacillus limi]SES88615.1 Glycosyltransferase involved in cell wall bisynthesis [Oceanobacillus limi]
MKICFLAAASSIHTVRWVNAIAARKHEVHLITMHRIALDQINSNVTVHKLTFPAPVGYYANALEVKLLLRSIKPDLLHAHYASGYGTLSRLVHYRPTLLSVWGSDVYLFPYQSKRNGKIIQKNLKAANHITSTSHAMKEQTERIISVTREIDVIPFGIDLELFNSKQKGGNDEQIVIGTIKGLKPVYGIDILIESTAKLIQELTSSNQANIAEKIRLKIVGDGPELVKLQQLTEKLNIADITEFVGAVPNEQVPNYLNQLDIYCAFSRSESFGVAVLEASACKVPVVVSNVGGLPEVVKDGETGYVVNTEDSSNIVEKLRILVSDKDKRHTFGRNGRSFVQHNFEWEKNVMEMEKVYSDIIIDYPM